MGHVLRSVEWTMGRHIGNTLWDMGMVGILIFFALVALRSGRRW